MSDLSSRDSLPRRAIVRPAPNAVRKFEDLARRSASNSAARQTALANLRGAWSQGNQQRPREVFTAVHLKTRTLEAAQAREKVMSRRSVVSLAASVIIGSASIVIIPNDATAYSSRGIPIYQPGVNHGGVYRGGVYRGAYYRGGHYRGVAPGVALGAAVGGAAVGAAGAYYAPRCGYFPYGPCY